MHLPLSAPWSFRHQYNLPQAAWGAAKEAFQTWIDNKVVEPGDPSSDFNTPLVVVAKKDLNGLKTSYRVCLDFRHIKLLLLQKYTHARERMPLLHEALGRLNGFTLQYSAPPSTYEQPTHSSKSPRRTETTFTYNNRKWRWARWPFGLAPATAKLQKVMEMVMK
jgi:hypothetical protein